MTKRAASESLACNDDATPGRWCLRGLIMLARHDVVPASRCGSRAGKAREVTLRTRPTFLIRADMARIFNTSLELVVF